MRREVVLAALVHLLLAHEVCTDFRAAQAVTMNYCTDYSGKTCCSTQAEAGIQSLVNSLAVTDQTCLSFLRKILCAQCDPWGAHLFDNEGGSDARNTTLLCGDYCARFYAACAGVTIAWPGGVSPFGTDPSRAGSASAFCANQVPKQSFLSCYNGTVFSPQPPSPPPAGSSSICVEPLALAGGDDTNTRITNLVSAFDGTPRMFATRQGGDVVVVNITDGAEIGTFLSIDTVNNAFNEAGLLGIAFHPNYRTNGRFFVHYTCQESLCPVPCNSTLDCAGATCTGGVCSLQGIEFVSVVAEYRVSANNPNVANPNEVKRLLSVAQPFGNHNGGQLLFGPDGLLYIFYGDGGSSNDPRAYSQNMGTLLGKALRIDVDSAPDPGKTYKVPVTNPFYTNKYNEIFALGLRNPWKCSFDAGNPAYLFCGDVGQDNVEEFDLIVRGGNYGWRKFEGTRLNNPGDPNLVNPKPPILEYNHAQYGGNPSSIGGYVYRGSRDSCFYNKYIYADHTAGFWAAVENPPTSGAFSTSRISLRCTAVGRCNYGKIFAFGEDHNRDLYIVGATAVMRVVQPSRCGLPPCVANTTADLITLTATADAFLRTGQFAGVNYGNDPTLRIKYAPASDFARESIVKFDLAPLATANFSSCTLRLPLQSIESNQAPPFPLSLGFVADDSWQELTVTYNNRPNYASIGTVNVLASQAFIMRDITQQVRTELAGDKLLSLYLYRDSGNTVDQVILSSRETANGPNIQCDTTFALTSAITQPTLTQTSSIPSGSSGTQTSSISSGPSGTQVTAPMEESSGGLMTVSAALVFLCLCVM